MPDGNAVTKDSAIETIYAYIDLSLAGPSVRNIVEPCVSSLERLVTDGSVRFFFNGGRSALEKSLTPKRAHTYYRGITPGELSKLYQLIQERFNDGINAITRNTQKNLRQLPATPQDVYDMVRQEIRNLADFIEYIPEPAIGTGLITPEEGFVGQPYLSPESYGVWGK